MDTTTPTTTPTTATPDTEIKPITKYWRDQVKKLVTNRKVLIIAGVGIILLIIIGVVISQQKPATNTTNNIVERFKVDEPIAKVGEETIYGQDLNYVLTKNYPGQKNAPTTQNEDLKQLGLKTIALESAVLQAGQTASIVQLDSTTFNSSSKDYAKRLQLINQVRQDVTKNSDRYDASIISIWYYNMDQPTIPVAQAETIAKNKISQYYTQIINNRLTMAAAGDAIKKDADLAKIDTNYQGNAYDRIENSNLDEMPFTFPELNDALLKLKTGEVSPIIQVVREGEPTLKEAIDTKTDADINVTEQFFAIIKMDQLTPGKYRSLGTWTKEAVQKYTQSNL